MSTVDFQYAELFRIAVVQPFYQNGVCRQYKAVPEPDFVLEPTAGCIDTMKRLDLVFKRTDNSGGGIVLGRVQGTNAGGDALLRFKAAGSDVLSFLMLLSNPQVLNFNNLSLQPATGFIYYFSNDVADATAPRNQLHLSQDAAGVSDADILPVSTLHFNYHHLATVAPGGAQVTHVLTGQQVLPYAIYNRGGQSDLAFNLGPLPEGLCRLVIGGLQQQLFYYLASHLAQPVFGIVDCILSQALAVNYRILEPDRSLQPLRPLYTIRFNSRPTFWRYTVELQTNSPLYLEMEALSPADKTSFINQLNIESNDTAITFSQVTATDTRFVFVSDNPVPLQEKYFSATSLTHDVLNIMLKKYTADIARIAVVKAHLPYPSTAGIDAAAAPTVFSDIFLIL